jgi:hypothetical protein
VRVLGLTHDDRLDSFVFSSRLTSCVRPVAIAMSSNTSSSDALLIVNLNLVAAQLNRYLSIGILLFGSVGNLLNCLALAQRTLRSNPCASLFLASSLASLVTLVSGVAVRLLAGWNADLTSTVGWLCKIRVFVLFVSRTAASWLITMATVDRWFSSSIDAGRRQLSTLTNAQRATSAVLVVSCLIYSQMFYCIDGNLVNGPLRCGPISASCALLNDMLYVCVSVFVPSALMFVLGLLTVGHVRQSRFRRVQPTVAGSSSQPTNSNTAGERSKKPDRHLLKMLLIQVVLLTLFSLPQTMHNVYTNIIRGQTRSSLHNAVSSFALNLFFLLSYVTNGMPFYIYTLTGGTVFRQALSNGVSEFSRALVCRTNRRQ